MMPPTPRIRYRLGKTIRETAANKRVADRQRSHRGSTEKTFLETDVGGFTMSDVEVWATPAIALIEQQNLTPEQRRLRFVAAVALGMALGAELERDRQRAGI